MTYHEITGEAVQRGKLVLAVGTNEFRTESQSLEGELTCRCGEAFETIDAAKNHLRKVANES